MEGRLDRAMVGVETQRLLARLTGSKSGSNTSASLLASSLVSCAAPSAGAHSWGQRVWEPEPGSPHSLRLLEPTP